MTTPVERISLAPGFSISRVLTGLWQIADLERDGNILDPVPMADAMHRYVDAGFTTFDMADHYGSAEDIVGAYRERYASDGVQLFTKWVPQPGPTRREDVREAVQRALDRMNTDALDLMQLHAWVYADPVWLDQLYWLQELKDEGLIRHLGVTNVDTAHLRIVLNSGIDVRSNQVCFSLLDQRARYGMTDLCLEHDITLLAFGTVAGGFLTERWLGRPEPEIDALPTWSQMKYKRFIDQAGGWIPFQNLLAALKTVADRHHVSVANVACRWMLDEPGVGGIIVGARLGRSDHIADNLRLFDFAIDEESRDEIDLALEEMQAIPGDCGDEYRKPPFLTASGDLSHHVGHFPPPYHSRYGSDGRSRVVTGTVWEDEAGFSRAIRVGDRILVSGTTATHRDRRIGGDDPTAQFHFIVDKITGALTTLGGRLEDVVRTRVYVSREDVAGAVARAHGERFGAIQPANTLVQAGLIGEGYLVEMEVEAIRGDD